MTAPHASQLIDGYLARLRAAADTLPSQRRDDLVESIVEHIGEARAALSQETDADLLNILDRLGDPVTLVAEEQGYSRVVKSEPPAFRVGLLEAGALVLTPILWPVGVILLWTSSAWNWRDKLIGTLLPPGGFWFFAIVGVLVSRTAVHVQGGGCVIRGTVPHARAIILERACAAPPSQPPAWIALAILFVFVVLPIITAIYLGIRLRHGQSAGHSLPLAPQA